MKTTGWKGEPVDVVRRSDGRLTSIDNTRISAAREAGINVQANVHSFNSMLTKAEIERFTKGPQVPSTWGDAITIGSKADGKRGRAKQTVAFNLLYRLRLHGKAVLRFIHDPNVPFTNNLGERAVRMPKVKQKISGCFRTLDGANHFSIIRSCLDTLHMQGYGMLEVLRRAFAGQPIRPAACS